MKTVILCGGQGTRLREETEFKPKPLVEIVGKPILWHIMKIYAHYGFNDFILCLGYKGDMIKDHFLNYKFRDRDFELNLKNGKAKSLGTHAEDWNITFADTGLETQPGGRIKSIEQYVKDENFMVTYGDGVADINLDNLVAQHNKSGMLATITGVHPNSKFGIINVSGDTVLDFQEKPRLNEWISGGFFVFNRSVLDYFEKTGPFSVEENVFKKLAQEKKLGLYKHDRSWYCMDTYKDTQTLNQLWNEGKAAWKVWGD